MKKQWTAKGRVVYDRKEHPFTLRDFVRIGKKIGATIFRVKTASNPNLFRDVLALIENDTTNAVDMPEPFVFSGGGRFGGGGATGDFASKDYRLIVIIEEIR